MEIDGIKKVSRTSAQEVFAPSKTAANKKNGEVRANLFQQTDSAVKGNPPSGRIDEVAADIQIQLKRLNTELRFDVDNKSKQTTVRIIDVETGEVIRQIPSEDLLALRERMEDLIGVLYKSKA